MNDDQDLNSIQFIDGHKTIQSQNSKKVKSLLI